MPLALEPSQTFSFALKSDEAKPEAERPTFRFRFLSGRDYRQMGEELDDIDKLTSAVERRAGICVLLHKALAGWSNMVGLDGEAIKYGDDHDLDFLTDIEIEELIYQLRWRQRASEMERKKSASQSPSETADSAEDAESASPAVASPVSSKPSNAPNAEDEAVTNAEAASAT